MAAVRASNQASPWPGCGLSVVRAAGHWVTSCHSKSAVGGVVSWWVTGSGQSAARSCYVPDGAVPQRVIAGANGVGQSIGSGTSTFTLPASGVSAHATAVVLSVSESGPGSAGWLAAFPGGGELPTSSDLNFAARETTSGMVIVPVTSSRQFRILNHGPSLLLTVDLRQRCGFRTGGPGPDRRHP